MFRTFVFVSILILTSIASADDILLQPGESTHVVTPDKSYKISCSGNSLPTIVSRACYCSQVGSQFHAVLSVLTSAGDIKKTTLDSFYYEPDCRKRIEELKTTVCKEI